MRLKLKFTLPLLQMIMASALLWWNYVWGQSILHRTHGTFGPLPTFTVLIGINAPAALARELWFRHVPSPLEDVLLIPAVGLLWYWMALNIQEWRERRSVCMFHSFPLRIAGDVLLMAIGGLLCFTFIDEFRNPRWMGGWYTVLFVAVYGYGLFLAWSCLLIYFFGRDLILAIRQSNQGVE